MIDLVCCLILLKYRVTEDDPQGYWLLLDALWSEGFLREAEKLEFFWCDFLALNLSNADSLIGSEGEKHSRADSCVGWRFGVQKVTTSDQFPRVNSFSVHIIQSGGWWYMLGCYQYQLSNRSHRILILTNLSSASWQMEWTAGPTVQQGCYTGVDFQ